MNRTFMDPFQMAGLPEVIEEFLDDGAACCIAYNRRGTLLAVGCDSGDINIWRDDTRSIARRLTGHRLAVSSLSWSRNGRVLVSGSADGTVRRWSLESSSETARLELPDPVAHVSVNDIRPHLTLATTSKGSVYMIDADSGTAERLPPILPVAEGTKESSFALFGKGGSTFYMSHARGMVAAMDTESRTVLDALRLPAKAQAMSINRRGTQLLVTRADRVVCCVTIAPPDPTRSGVSLQDFSTAVAANKGDKNRSALHPGESAMLSLLQRYEDSAAPRHWSAACFSGDGEHVAAADRSKDAHLIYVWTVEGRLDRILEGPREACAGLAWHPLANVLASVAGGGHVYMWAKIYHENWSAFAPDFVELEENLEYVEKETEFDVNEELQEQAAKASSAQNEDEEMEDIDVCTVSPQKVFDSDASDEDDTSLHYLPVQWDETIAAAAAAATAAAAAAATPSEPAAGQEQQPAAGKEAPPAKENPPATPERQGIPLDPLSDPPSC